MQMELLPKEGSDQLDQSDFTPVGLSSPEMRYFISGLMNKVRASIKRLFTNIGQYLD